MRFLETKAEASLFFRESWSWSSASMHWNDFSLIVIQDVRVWNVHRFSSVEHEHIWSRVVDMRCRLAIGLANKFSPALTLWKELLKQHIVLSLMILDANFNENHFIWWFSLYEDKNDFIVKCWSFWSKIWFWRVVFFNNFPKCLGSMKKMQWSFSTIHINKSFLRLNTPGLEH